jgi:hypothetical protein
LAEAGIYPAVWDREDEADSNMEYLASYYATLRSYVEPSHETGSGCSSTSTESWNVEQREGWLVACRRLATRYDRQAASVLALLHLACALIWLRYLAHAELK